MHRTLLKSKIHRASVTDWVVHVNSHNEILATDDEVAALLRETAVSPVA